MTFPLTLYYFYELPVFAPLLNLLLLPILPLVLGSGAAGCLGGLISQGAGRMLLLPGKLALAAYDAVLQIVCRIPFATWILGKPSQIQMTIYYIAVGMWICLMYGRQKRRDKSVWQLLLPVLAVVCLCIRIPGGLQVTMLDVGQGILLCSDYRRERTICWTGEQQHRKRGNLPDSAIPEEQRNSDARGGVCNTR